MVENPHGQHTGDRPMLEGGMKGAHPRVPGDRFVVSDRRRIARIGDN